MDEIQNNRYFVPNAPCGVESQRLKGSHIRVVVVPNAPCGVERLSCYYYIVEQYQFLMHRVELKVLLSSNSYLSLQSVPNAPCGVES